jgi:hypothetical protein
MAKNSGRNKRTPRRDATRRGPSRSTHLSVVRDADPAPIAGTSHDAPVDLPDDASPAEVTAAVAGDLMAAVAGARRALEAELALCGMLGVVATGIEGDETEQDNALHILLGLIINYAERVRNADALAVLRVCAALGPPDTRAAAGAAADRVASSGVVDRPWAGRIGRPTFLRAWRYGDIFGNQFSVGALFDERGRDHALMVLVDNQLGGGVKDAWVAEGADARGMRDMIAARMADDPDAYFDDIDVATVAEALRDALVCPPCPEQDDQIEDVGAHLWLVRSRAERLAELAGIPASAGPDAEDAVTGPSGDVLRLKVSLQGIRPPIWRRLEVPASISLSRLHTVLQCAFDWSGGHLYCFEVGDGRRGGGVLEGAALRRTRLRDLVGAPGDRLRYRYDFGDDWEHLVEVEDRHAPEPGRRYPACTGGRRAAPPEDCGGIPGFAALLEALADPEHPDHDEMTAWVPDGYDPARFDVAAVDAALPRDG